MRRLIEYAAGVSAGSSGRNSPKPLAARRLAWMPDTTRCLTMAMARAATDAGVTIRYGAEVAHLVRTGNRARAVQLVDGERIDCDALVLTVDLPVARRELLDDPIRRELRYSPSCWLMLAGGEFDWPEPPRHHTVVFGRAWEQSLEELDSGRLMTDPSLLISTPTVSDPALAPSGRHCVSVLSPTPHLGRYGSQRLVQHRVAGAHRNHRVVPILPSITLGLHRLPNRSSRPKRPATRSE